MMVYMNGLILGLSLITSLGPQNIFLIRQGALRKHAFLAAFVCFFCDLILVSTSVVGLCHLLKQHPSLGNGLAWFGVVFLFYYGFRTFKQALKGSAKKEGDKQATRRWQIVILALGFSLLNPYAIIDTFVIIGSGSNQFPDQRFAFLLGVLSSSLIWFGSLTFTTHYFSEVLSRAQIWRRIELSSGLLMLFLSLKLAYAQI